MTDETKSKINSLRREGKSFRDIAKTLGISKTMAQYHTAPNAKEKFLENQKSRRREFKLKLIALFGGKCKFCNYKKSISALDFHHVNPQEKEIGLSKIMSQGTSERHFNLCVEEAKKCILVCSNCHHEIHDGLK
jgi:predicted HNH restriction endonuclease